MNNICNYNECNLADNSKLFKLKRRPDLSESQLDEPRSLTAYQKKVWDYIHINKLGFMNTLCVPHYCGLQRNGWKQAEASELMVTELADYPCIGIDEEALFVVDGHIAKVVQGEKWCV